MKIKHVHMIAREVRLIKPLLGLLKNKIDDCRETLSSSSHTDKIQKSLLIDTLYSI